MLAGAKRVLAPISAEMRQHGCARTQLRPVCDPAATSGCDGAGMSTPRIERFLARNRLETPFVVLDLDVVAIRYHQLRDALPGAHIHYAVKANPAIEILRLLVDLGSSFDVASPAEIDLCLEAGADPSTISYGNTVKKERDIAYAFRRGVRLFAFDSAEELAKIVRAAPGSTVCCRLPSDGGGADWPLSRKFGCDPAMATDLLLAANRQGLEVGLSFHVGSQQRDPQAWDRYLDVAASIFATLRKAGVEPAVLNIGGGFPGLYREGAPGVAAYGDAIRRSLRRFGSRLPRIIAEPGRYLVAGAGVLQSEVVLVARKSEADERRWVYLDVGMFGGLAETMGESIRYRIRTPHDGAPTGPVAIAGPTCDSADVLYERSGYELPLALRAGDRVELLSTGAYTTTYSSVAFNGFAPLRSYCLPSAAAGLREPDHAAA
nr:diaminopimelate decarboxylase [uncultured bacterium]